jgi:hypothetical protein
MNGWRQIHEDGSQSVLLRNGHIWQIKLILARKGRANYVGLMTSNLEEAKAICSKALQNESLHVCTKLCRDWEEC